jgi:hypothetical protein
METDRDYLRKVVPNLDGWCPVNKAIQLYNLASEFESPTCVELGVFAGRSFVALALAAKAKAGTAIGIDAWSKQASTEGKNDKTNDDYWNKIDYDYFFKYSQRVINNAGAHQEASLIRKRSDECVDMFPDNSINLLHQDSNHSEKISVAEVELWHKKVKKGGYWVFDDTHWSTTEAAQSLLESKGYECIFTADEKIYKIYRRT